MTKIKNITSRTVLVTGASSGIGEATALRLDKEGFRVLAGVRREQDAEALREQASDRLIPVMLDVTDAVSIEQATKTVEETVGPAGLDGLVNNAGFGIPGPLEFLPIDDARKQFEINLFGLLSVTQALLPLLRRGNGRIVNMGSMGGRVAFPFMGVYSASKFALEGLTDALRVELSPWKLHVSLIEPGSIATPGWDKLKRGAEETARKLPETGRDLYETSYTSAVESMMKLGSKGISPDAVAKAVLHALTASKPKTRYIVGRDAKMMAVMAKIMPDRMRDSMLRQQLRLPKAA